MRATIHAHVQSASNWLRNSVSDQYSRRMMAVRGRETDPGARSSPPQRVQRNLCDSSAEAIRIIYPVCSLSQNGMVLMNEERMRQRSALARYAKSHRAIVRIMSSANRP